MENPSKKDRIMLLSSLIASSDGINFSGTDLDIVGLTEDSRKVKPGYLFIATPGTKQDGRTFIDDAIMRGAVAVLLPQGLISPSPLATLTTLDIRRATADLATAFYPQQPEVSVAVTGTSGKTSTAQFVREMWQAMGHKSASIGTLGLVTAQGASYGSLTTPDAITLHHLLDDCAQHGTTHIAIETSSHGIELRRLDKVHFKAGGFTNLSRDHLDYHLTMEAYLAAKLRLFADLLPLRAAAVLNADIPEYSVLADTASKRGLQILSYGSKGTDIRLVEMQPDPKGQILKVEIFGKMHEVLLPVLGRFQVWNAMCAMGLVIGSGGDVDRTVTALQKITGVPGRLQYIGTSAKGGAVFVDYAHKPDALDNVLQALRPQAALAKGKLGVIFGCGGNRDKGKRPIMGEIAQKRADWVIVTDDNPRHEEPATIRAEIMAGCADKDSDTHNVTEIGDRAKAITEGIARLGRGDVMVIAGKGHEPGQIVGDKVLPFDDAEEARKVLGL
jgi:UDP-N-acetylmuramoyl-L-alanyl-D-glutamate--2,6-diaminopimelate ligase